MTIVPAYILQAQENQYLQLILKSPPLFYFLELLAGNDMECCVFQGIVLYEYLEI